MTLRRTRIHALIAMKHGQLSRVPANWRVKEQGLATVEGWLWRITPKGEAALKRALAEIERHHMTGETLGSGHVSWLYRG